jgi:hypothetical protein
MKIVLGDFNAKMRRKNIFKPTVRNESLHQDRNDNVVRIVNFATLESLVVESTMFSHQNIYKHTWCSVLTLTKLACIHYLFTVSKQLAIQGIHT